jgi:toxin CptA
LVGATYEMAVEGQRTSLWVKLLLVATIAGTFGLLTIATGTTGHYPAGGGTMVAVILAAAVMALGTLINGGCYFGSIVYLSRGRSDYLFTLIGIGIAARIGLADRFGVAAMSQTHEAPSAPVLSALTGLAVVVALLAGYAAWRSGASGVSRRVLYTMLAAVCASLLFLHLPGWTYGTVLTSLSQVDRLGFNWHQNALGAAFFGGAIVSSIVGGLSQPTWLTFTGTLRCLAGGFVMESAARMIPGGNDTLLLWAIPGFGSYGLIAYATMFIMLLACWRVTTLRRATT